MDKKLETMKDAILKDPQGKKAYDILTKLITKKPSEMTPEELIVSVLIISTYQGMANQGKL